MRQSAFVDAATRRYLAWDSILGEKDTLDLSPYQVKQAETQRAAADSAVAAQLPETYHWVLAPEQKTPQGDKSPQADVEWESLKPTGNDPLAVRASKKLKSAEALISALGPTILRKYLDEVPLWRGDHVAIKQVAEDFGRYPYLPRLTDPSVLVAAIRDGLSLLTWEQDTFAYADEFDEDAGRYRGLVCGQLGGNFDRNSPALLVRPDVAAKQLRDELSEPPGGGDEPPEGPTGGGGDEPGPDGPEPPEPRALVKRFHEVSNWIRCVRAETLVAFQKR